MAGISYAVKPPKNLENDDVISEKTLLPGYLVPWTLSHNAALDVLRRAKWAVIPFI